MDLQWEDGFQHLEEYVAAHGNALVPDRHESPDGYKLGRWVESQRASRDKLDDKRKRRLDAIKGWIWEIGDLQWQKEFEYLEEYIAAYGNALVPTRHQSPDGFKLGRWVESQRRLRHKMNAKRVNRLEALEGWVWQVKR